MNKKKIIIVFSIIIIIISLSLLGITLYNKVTNYSNVLKINWDIEIPKEAKVKEIYSANSDVSIHGDGLRYHIFSYKNEDKITDMVNWSKEEKETLYYPSYHESVNNWLNEINVSKNKYPDYTNCKYWYTKKDDNSEIIILLDDTKNLIYVVESFL